MASSRINTHDIAKRAGVSIGTVSNVVNESAKVSEELRRRVLNAMDELGWQPNELARGLRKASSSIIGMIIPDITNPFFPAVVRGAEDVASKHGHRILLCNTDNHAKKEMDSFSDLRSFNPAGFLIIPSSESRIERAIQSYRKPVVFVDRSPSGWKGDAVTADNQEGAYLATMHLLESGHREVAIITGSLKSTNGRARLLGFQRAVGQCRIKVPAEFQQQAQFTRESGYLAAKKLIQMLPRPTAIFASNDLIAAGTLRAIKEAGLSCPEDLSVVGFDNLDFTDLTDPELTSIYQPGYQMGSQAAHLLLERIMKPEREASQIVLPTELRIRASVKVIKTRKQVPDPSASKT
jgi:LacI family transcriptional regulator